MTKKDKCLKYPKECKSIGQINSDGLCPRCVKKQVREILLEAIKGDVQKTHTETGITTWVEIWHATGASFEIISKAFPDGITSQDIRRAEMGIMPVHNWKRELLGLPQLVKVPACPHPGCTDPHQHKHDELPYTPATQHPTANRPKRARHPRAYVFDAVTVARAQMGMGV